jgi:histidinol-phosphate aminotransferase
VDLFVGKGDNVVSIEPSFFAYEKRVLLKEGEFFGVPLKKDLSLDRKAMLKRSNARTRLAFVCSPNNPTGNVFEPAEVEALVNESSAIIVVDEAYAEFADSTLVPLAATKKNVVVLRTFSKAFGLAGLRFGYAVANPDMALTLSNIMPYTVNSVTSRFVVRLLSHLDIIERCTEMVKAERKRLIEGLDTTRGTVVLESKANFVTFTPGKDPTEVYEKLLRRGILVKDLGDLPVIGHCLRVTVGLPSMNERFLKALTEIIS